MRNVRAYIVAGLSAGLLFLSAPVVGLAQDGPNQETRQANFGNLISALNNVSTQVQALNNLDAENIEVVTVDVSEVVSGNNVEALNNALNRNQTEINVLQNALNNNEVIKNALNNNNIAVTDVVAVDVLSGGDVIVFYRK